MKVLEVFGCFVVSLFAGIAINLAEKKTFFRAKVSFVIFGNECCHFLTLFIDVFGD